MCGTELEGVKLKHQAPAWPGGAPLQVGRMYQPVSYGECSKSLPSLTALRMRHQILFQSSWFSVSLGCHGDIRAIRPLNIAIKREKIVIGMETSGYGAYIYRHLDYL